MRPTRLISLSSRTAPLYILVDLLYFTLFFLLPVSTGATESPGRGVQDEHSGVYRYASPSKDGTGKIYMGREIARALDRSAASWLDRPDREVEERPDLLLKSMNLEPTDVVADVGAGTGFFSFRMGAIVAEGKVLAVDILPEMLEVIEARASDKGVENVIPVLGTSTNPSLPDATVDKVLMVDAYHEFSHPREMMEAMKRTLKPGGVIFLVEYRGEERELPIKPLHKMTEEQARIELEAVGLEWVETRDFLPHQHVIVFQKK